MRHLHLLTLTLLFAGQFAFSAEKNRNTVLYSPDGQLKVTATSGARGLTWAIERNGKPVLDPSRIQITIDGCERLSGTARETARQEVNTAFSSPFYKKATIHDHYNTVTLRYGKEARVEFRAYDEGAAYRILSDNPQAKRVDDEYAEFNFAADYPAFIPYVNDLRGRERYCFSFESYYDEIRLSEMAVDSLSITPLAVCLPDGVKAIVMDAGVENYPGMMLKGEGNSLKAEFPPIPGECIRGGHGKLNLVPLNRLPYIASLDGPAVFPWRAVVVTGRDADILNCDMAQLLSPACRIADPSWIVPGKATWEWWNSINLTGVDFVAGTNTPTYKAFIDFAAENKLEYVLIDSGWSDKDLFHVKPAIDLPGLVAYARERGVGLLLWANWADMVDNDPVSGYGMTEHIMELYAGMGIKGFKIDFVDRDDQIAVRSMYRIAECAARRHLVLDYHGFRPSGVQRAWPNILNFEGVKGLENLKWAQRNSEGPILDQTRYDVTAPYLRMLAGPMDYTPGAMHNALKDNFFGNGNHPMSQGTRVHQMALYTLFEAPLQMLADSPTLYRKEQECTDFIAQVPTVFDETVALDGKLGEYLVLARRKGDTWFVAALTDWTERDLVIDLSFLPAGKRHALIFADGVNAHRNAEDYSRREQPVSASDKLSVHLAGGGGWTAIIR